MRSGEIVPDEKDNIIVKLPDGKVQRYGFHKKPNTSGAHPLFPINGNGIVTVPGKVVFEAFQEYQQGEKVGRFGDYLKEKSDISDENVSVDNILKSDEKPSQG